MVFRLTKNYSKPGREKKAETLVGIGFRLVIPLGLEPRTHTLKERGPMAQWAETRARLEVVFWKRAIFRGFGEKVFRLVWRAEAVIRPSRLPPKSVLPAAQPPTYHSLFLRRSAGRARIISLPSRG